CWNSLTCPEVDAYDGLLNEPSSWETGLYVNAASHGHGFVSSVTFFDGRDRAEEGREEAGRRAEKGNSERRQSGRRRGERSARAERSVTDVGAQRFSEGAGQQGIRAVHRRDRSVE